MGAQKEAVVVEEGCELVCMGVTSALQPVSNVQSVGLTQYVSEGAVAMEEGADEAAVTVLRDTASGISILLAGTINLPDTAAVGRYVPAKGFGGTEYLAVPLYRVFVRTTHYAGYAEVGVAPELPVAAPIS